MILINLFIISFFFYSSAFLYFFSFNENFLLIFFFSFFLYIINSKLLGFLFEATDVTSLEVFLTFKNASQGSLSKLKRIRYGLGIYSKTDAGVLSSFESFLNLQLGFFLFTKAYSELFHSQLLYLGVLKLIGSQNNFSKDFILGAVNLGRESTVFESE